ncbi:MAG: hypothetical protein WKG07_47540 [Hymenobacter sp.]
MLGELSPATTNCGWCCTATASWPNILFGTSHRCTLLTRPARSSWFRGAVALLPQRYRRARGGFVMTRADRLAEIEDQATYLDALLGHLRAAAPAGVSRLTVLGFRRARPRPAAGWREAASRWRPERLILWAGDFPADIEADSARYLLVNLPVALVSGEQDEYMSADVASAQAGYCGARRTVSQHSFAGGHTLHAGLLRQAARGPYPL